MHQADGGCGDVEVGTRSSRLSLERRQPVALDPRFITETSLNRKTTESNV
jgi:hypothetical protein